MKADVERGVGVKLDGQKVGDIKRRIGPEELPVLVQTGRAVVRFIR